MSKENKRAVIYLRVSSSGQVDKARDPEGYSIPAQREACQRYADQLDASVVAEYMEPGKSGTSTKRPALQKMLSELGDLRPDFVIFYDLSRVARDDFDALWLLREIEQHGCKLESTLERVDDSPAGRLLYTIMAGVNAFRSRGDAVKVKAGLERKHETGGTPFRAPIGYVNAREIVEGREVRVVAIDNPRAQFVTRAFDLYATGEYSLSELAGILEAEGFRTRPRGKNQPAPVGVNRLAGILRNDYYIGKVSYNGKVVQGEHEPLVDEAKFRQVQDLLDARRQSGERNWRNYHYLRGSVYCGECGGRLFFSRVRNRAGNYYGYFVCRGRQEHRCSQPNHRVVAVEGAIERCYVHVGLTPKQREAVRSAVHVYVDQIRAQADGKSESARNLLIDLESQEAKLLTAHYADQISDALFQKETQRIQRERAAAERVIKELEVPFEEALATLDKALDLTTDIQRAYEQGDGQERRLLNQAFFERLEIVREDTADQKLHQPFSDLIALSRDVEEGKVATDKAELAAMMGRPTGPPETASESETAAVQAGLDGGEDERTPATLSGRGGSHVESMVRPNGVEPSRVFPPTRPSTLRVYQFRHGRVGGDSRWSAGAVAGIRAKR